MWPNPQFPADLVTFAEEILNGKLHFLCSDDYIRITILFIYFIQVNAWLIFHPSYSVKLFLIFQPSPADSKPPSIWYLRVLVDTKLQHMGIVFLKQSHMYYVSSSLSFITISQFTKIFFFSLQLIYRNL